MTASGRVFKPIDIKDCMDEEQLAFFVERLKEIIDHGFGELTITITNHHVNTTVISKSSKFPFGK